MQYSTILAAIAAVVPSVAAAPLNDPVHTFNVYNHCKFDVYYNSVLHYVPGGKVDAAANDSGVIIPGAAFHETYPNRKGRAVQLARDSALTNAISANYSFNGTQIYYELIGGSQNPFIQYFVDYSAVSPPNAACTPFECAKGDYSCYSTGVKGSGQHVYSCTNVNNHLTVNLCDPSP